MCSSDLNVAYGPRVKKLSRKQVEKDVTEMLESMNLAHLAKRAPNQLSGGQQQRVALARAMVVRPKVLLFDEPLSNLDAKLRAQMRIEIRSIQRQLGITSIFVTHDQDEAMSLSDRIVVMRNAVVEQVGTPEEIYRHPNSVFVADFIGRSNFLAVDSLKKLAKNRAEVLVSGKKMSVRGSSKSLSSSKPTLLVRPESIEVKRSKSSPKNLKSAEGLVENVVFYGNHVEYSINMGSNMMTAVVSNPVFEEVVPIGAVAKIDFDPERTWLLPAEN